LDSILEEILNRKPTTTFSEHSKSKTRASKGLINGTGTPRALAISNPSNGLTNGNGLTTGTGTPRAFTLHNSSGLVNGNGLTNGHAFVNGNGLTNGNGFTNGTARSRRTNREIHIELLRTRSLRNRILTAAIAIILILLPLTLYISDINDIENNYIAIDGEFDDWQDIYSYPDRVGDQPINPNIDITDYRFRQDSDNGYLAFYIEVNGIMLKGKKLSYSEDQVFGLDTVHIFIDTDSSSKTGYLFNEIGADHLIEVKGYNNWIQSSTLKRFDHSRNQFDWSGWEYINDVEARCRDRRLETKIWLAEIGSDNIVPSKVSIGFHIQDTDGNEDQADILVGNHDNILVVTQTNCMPDVVERSNEPARVLDLNFNSVHQTSYLNELEMNIKGTVGENDIENIELVIDKENIKLADGQISEGVAKFVMDEPLELESGQYYNCHINVELSSTSTSYRTLGLNIGSGNDIVLTDQESLVDIETLNQGLSYIGECPDKIEIDGAFGDWDPVPDMFDTDPCENRNIDINTYKIAQSASEISFYFQVEGEMMGGTIVPIDPDIVRPVNIQPTPIVNNAQSQATIENVGAQINEQVPVPELFGEDNAYIFIDTDLNDTTGLYVEGQSVGAEYLIQLTGKNGGILSSNYYKYRSDGNFNLLSTRSSDNWQYLGRVPSAKDSTRLETKLDFAKFGFYSENIEGLKVFFYFEDWAKNQDMINEPVNITGFVESSNLPGSESLFGTRGAGDPLNVLASGVGNDANDRFGWNVSDLGDINNDGYDDIIVGAPFNDGYNGLDSWWDSNWNNRKKLIFNNSGQTEDLIEFPILVNLSSSNFDYLKAKNDGTDLRFIDEDGSSELIYHIEEWNAAGYSQIWVNVTNITGSSDTDYIWMYYNNSAAIDNQDVESTYNANYTGVWHLNETGTGTRYDSTKLANHGTPGGYEGDEATAGKISGADDFDNGGTGDSLNCGIDAIADAPYHTISAWLNMDLTTGDANNLIISHEDFAAPQKGIGLYIQKSDGAIGKWLNSAYQYSSTNLLTTGEWAFAAIRGYQHLSAGYVEVSMNGGAWENIFSGDTSTLAIISGATLYFGKWLGPGPTRDANGIVDEVKISNVARSLDWIRAQYLSTNNSFITYGNEESYDKPNCGAAYIFYGYPSLELTDINASNANITLTGANVGDNFGWSISSAGDVDGNSYNDIIIGAPGADEAYIFLSLDDGSGIANGASPNITLTGNSGDKFGYSVDSAGKFDKVTEGYSDIIVGAPYNDTIYTISDTIQNTGAVFFFYNNGSMSTTINAINANLTHRGENSSNYFGSSVAGAGDVNNDGFDDVIVGAPGYNTSQGRAYVYYGNSTYIDDDFEAYSGDNPGGNWVTSENEVDYIVDMTSAVSHGSSGSKMCEYHRFECVECGQVTR
jgi:hypothetical protein